MGQTDGLFGNAGIEDDRRSGTCSNAKVVFKPTHRGECYLLPPSLDELVGAENLVRFIDAVVDRLDLNELIEQYRGGGASAYHPSTLLKIWLFGWCRKVYTSRPLAAALTRDIEFMWLAGEQRPSFVTLADFRRRLNANIKDIFKEVVGLAIDVGLVQGEEIYIDHTKMEANANRHRVVRRLSRKMSRERSCITRSSVLFQNSWLHDSLDSISPYQSVPSSSCCLTILLDSFLSLLDIPPCGSSEFHALRRYGAAPV